MLDLLRQHWLWYYKHKAKDIVTSDWSDVQTKLDEWSSIFKRNFTFWDSIDQHDLVIVKSDWKVYKVTQLNWSDYTIEDTIWVSQDTWILDDVKEICLLWWISDTHTDLIPWTKVYISSTWQITTTETDIKLGIIITTTEIKLNCSIDWNWTWVIISVDWGQSDTNYDLALVIDAEYSDTIHDDSIDWWTSI